MTSLSESLDRTPRATIEQAIAWKASKEGDSLIGDVVSTEWVEFSDREPSYLVTITATERCTMGGVDQELGIRYSLWVGKSPAILHKGIHALNPEAGDTIAIRFDGSQPSTKAGFGPLKLYTIQGIDRDGKPINHTRLPEYGEPTAQPNGKKSFEDDIPF